MKTQLASFLSYPLKSFQTRKSNDRKSMSAFVIETLFLPKKYLFFKIRNKKQNNYKH